MRVLNLMLISFDVQFQVNKDKNKPSQCKCFIVQLTRKIKTKCVNKWRYSFGKSRNYLLDEFIAW